MGIYIHAIITNEIKARNFKENRKLYVGLFRGNKEKAEMCNYIIISRKQKKTPTKRNFDIEYSPLFSKYTQLERN